MTNARVRRFQSLWRFNPRHRASERNYQNESCWLGMADSDCRMRESKSRALPLGESPTSNLFLCQDIAITFYRVSV